MSHLHSSLVVVPSLDDEDLLREILLRLPPQPSFLLRASLVCKLWRRILSDHLFLRRFRKHHQKPSLLGFFHQECNRVPIFTPILDSPDRIPVGRFTLLQKRSSYKDDRFYITGCRHALVVLVQPPRNIIVWDPLTRQKKFVPFPTLQDYNGYPLYFWHAVVVCADSEDGHVHGDCFASPFKLVFICGVRYMQACACIYESASGAWENIVPMVLTDSTVNTKPSVLVGNAVYWLLHGGDAVAFDFERRSFALIKKPGDAHIINYKSLQILRTEDGGLGLAVLSELIIKFWEWKSNSDGVGSWMLLQKTIQLELFPCTMPIECKTVLIVGYDEDSNVIVLSTTIGNFTLQVDSMRIRHIIKRDTICHKTLYPYKSFHIVGTVKPCEDDIGCGSKRSKLYLFARSLVHRTKKQFSYMFTIY